MSKCVVECAELQSSVKSLHASVDFFHSVKFTLSSTLRRACMSWTVEQSSLPLEKRNITNRNTWAAALKNPTISYWEQAMHFEPFALKKLFIRGCNLSLGVVVHQSSELCDFANAVMQIASIFANVTGEIYSSFFVYLAKGKRLFTP